MSSASRGRARPFHVVFTDTCVGGSTVAARVARDRKGLRAFYLADYAVNPLGVKSEREVRDALDRWVDTARNRSSTMVVACNTASILLRDCPEVRARAKRAGMAVHSMVDLLEATLGSSGRSLEGRRVCLMGTAFTVGRPRYSRILTEAGAASVEPLAATRTERTIAHLQHRSPEGRRAIRDEIEEGVGEADVVALACTCFPLVGDLIRELNPEIELLDPGAGVDRLALPGDGSGSNRLTVGLTGDVLTPEAVRANASRLFPGWALEAVLRL